VENDPAATEVLSAAARRIVGDDRVVATQQSSGGEDFSWFLEKVPGSYARLGVRAPGATTSLDIHAGTFDVDEAAIGVGVAVLVETALDVLRG
jgi:amidohydrolase